MLNLGIHKRPPSALDLDVLFHKTLPTLAYSKNIGKIGMAVYVLQILVCAYASALLMQAGKWGTMVGLALTSLAVGLCAIYHNRIHFQEVVQGKLSAWQYLSVPLSGAAAVGAEIYVWAILCQLMLTPISVNLQVAIGSGVLLFLISACKAYFAGVVPVKNVTQKLEAAREIRPVNKISQKLILKLACAHPEVASYLSKLAALKRLPTKGELWMLTKHHLSNRKQLTYSGDSASQGSVRRLTSAPKTDS